MADPTPKLKAIVVTSTGTPTAIQPSPTASTVNKVPSGSFIVADAGGVFIGGSDIVAGGATAAFPVPTQPIALDFTTTSGFTEDIDLTQTYVVGAGTVRILFINRHIS